MTVEERIGRLEGRCRRLSLALVALVAAALMVGAAAGSRGTTATLSRIILPDGRITFVTSAGRRLMRLEDRNGTPSLWLYNKSGALALTLSGTSSGGVVNVKGADGEGGARIGSSFGGTRGSVLIWGEKVDGMRGPALLLTRDEHGGVLRLWTNDLKKRATLTVDSDDKVYLRAYEGNSGAETVESNWPQR